MKTLLALLLLALPLAAQQLPEAPQPQPRAKILDKRFVATESSMYGGILFDLAASMHWVGNCYTEGNPWFAKNHGYGFKAGTYVAVNLPIAAGFTVVHALTRRYAPKTTSEGRIANWLMDGIVLGVGAPHYVAAGRWVNDCH